MKKKKSARGKIVKLWGEHFHISKVHEKAPGTKLKGFGVYALYKGKKLVYAGLATKSLRGRLKQHIRHKKGKWDHFSFYQVIDSEHIKDIETLILRVSKPKLNKRKGTFRSKYEVK